MRHVRFRWTIDNEIVEVDFYRLEPDEIDELPGDPTAYSTGKVDGEFWAAKITGVEDLINPLRLLGH
jgi:hypothetical protein